MITQEQYLTAIIVMAVLCAVIVAIVLIESRRRYLLIEELSGAQKDLDISKNKLESVIEHTNIHYWEYDIEEDVAYPGVYMRESLGFPEKIPNYSHYLLDNGTVHPSSIPAHNNMYERLRGGEKEVRVILRLATDEGMLQNWRRIHHTVYIDPVTNKRMALATSENVSDYKRMENTTNIALAQANIGVVAYDIPSKRLTRLQDDPDGLFPPGGTIENVPECYLLDPSLYEADRRSLVEMYESLKKGDSAVHCTFRRYKSDGSIWWGRVNYTNTYDKFGNAYRAIGTYEDITERVRAEGRYLTQLKYRNTSGRDAITSIRTNLTQNRTFDIFTTNVGYSELLHKGNYSDIINTFVERIPDLEMQEEFLNSFSRENLMHIYEEGQDTLSYVHLLNGYDTKPIWIQTQVNMMANPVTGDVESIIYQFDASSLKFEQMITEQLLESDYIQIALVDLFRNIYIPLKALRYHGVREEQEFERNYEELLDKFIDNQVVEREKDYCRFAFSRDNIEREVEKNGVYIIRYTVEINGEERNRRAMIFMFSEQLSLYAMAISDYTEDFILDMERSRELEKAVREAEIANNAKSDFLSRMSHDIRTPMNAIMGLTDLCDRDLDDKQAMQDHIVKLKKTSGYLLNLINDMLDMTKFESGKMIFRSEAFSVEECMSDVLAINMNNIRDKHLQVNYEDNEVTRTVFISDAVRFRQIVMNLLSNAIKFTPEGGSITINAHALERTDTEMKLILEVKDTGIGMAPEFVAHLFEPFSQENTAISRNYIGTGLGLSIVKNLVEGLGGEIHVSSAQGEGTTFTLVMKVKLADDRLKKEAQIHMDGKFIEHFDFAGRKILVAEDNDINYEIMEALLEEVNVDVTWAQNGKEAVEAVANHPAGYFDAVLMDIRMPEMDGLEATRNIRLLPMENVEKLPIFAMTANAFDEDRHLSMQAGMNSHLTKPIQSRQLYETLYAFFEQSGK